MQPVAQADDLSIIATWPPEGASLPETYERAPTWREVIAARDNALRDRSNAEYFINIVCRAALHKCGRWINDLLQSGSLVLTAYRSERLWGKSVTFAASVARQLSFDESGEVVRGPHGEIFYSPRFYAKATMAAKPARRVEIVNWPGDAKEHSAASDAAIRSNKDWLEWAVRNIPPDDRDYGWKYHYAQKLEHEMKKAAKTNKKLKSIKAPSIAARLRERHLWSEINDETTTK
jgi:hypothetical protein